MVQTHNSVTMDAPSHASGSTPRNGNERMATQHWPATATIAFTPAGRASLAQELRHLLEERLPALAVQLAEARDDTAARKENADLALIQLEQHRLERRAAELAWLLAMAREVVPPANGMIALGSRVEIEDDGERDVFQLVDPREANVAEGRISTVSPVGQALLGQRTGAEVVVAAPAGARRLRIVAVS